MFANVRAVAFDLDDTLWDVGPVIERAEVRLYDWIRQHCPRIAERVSRDDMRAAREQLAREEPHKAHDFTYLRLTALARHVRECGYEEAMARRAFDVFFAARNEIEVFTDVRPALTLLRPRYQLATLSNGNADLARIGLSQFFGVSLNAGQIGVGKPHRHCFERLVSELAVAPDRIVYVGDDPVLDIDAARSVGLLTAWVNRFGQAWPATLAPADIVVTNCTELVQALGVA